MRIPAAPIALCALALPAALCAQTRHNSQAPIDFSADSGELQDKAGRGILTGHVVIRQAEMTLAASRVTLTYSGKVTDGAPELSRVDATGGVTVTQPDKVARAQYGIYDINRRVVIMMGGVTLNQGTNTVNGNRLTINLDTGKAVIDGSGVSSGSGAAGVKTGPGGRVTGRFSVPKRNS